MASRIAPGDVVLGLASSGAHSNGYSLIRRILARAKPDLSSDFHGRPFGEVILAPTRIYVKPVLGLLERVPVKGLAHITGGGLLENVPRILVDGLTAELDRRTWPRPPLFDWLQSMGAVDDQEMLRVFNCGIGMVVVVDSQDARRACTCCQEAGEQVYGSASYAAAEPVRRRRLVPMKRIVILISGRGSNLQSLARSATAGPGQRGNQQQPAGARGSESRAPRDADASVDHRGYRTREDFDHALAAAIDAHGPDLVVLAGFMRILTPGFVQRYAGRMINIHPSLLPAFTGIHTHRRALPRACVCTAAPCTS